MTWRIPLSDLDYGSEEESAVLRVLKSKWLSMGAETKAFEEEFATMQGAKHAYAVANATAGLHLAFLALGLGPGDEIIQPALNFVATANMTVAVGATPVFADILGLAEPTLDPTHAGGLLITPRTRAVVVMHYGGYPGRMAELAAICKERGLALIEDACHAIGARYVPTPRSLSASGGEGQGEVGSTTPTSDLRPPASGSSGAGLSTLNPQPSTAVGSLGDISAFSFFSNKNLATGEGGMVVTGRDDLAEKVRLLRSHGMTSLTWDRHHGHAATYDVATHGYNYRMDDLRAAIGREQLKKLKRNNQRRRELTALYWDKLAPLEHRGWVLPFKRISAFSFQLSALNREATSCHLMAVVAPDAESRWRCAEALKAEGIQTSLHYPLIPGFTAFQTPEALNGIERSKEFCARVITLPLYPTMIEEQVEVVCEALTTA